MHAIFANSVLTASLLWVTRTRAERVAEREICIYTTYYNMHVMLNVSSQSFYWFDYGPSLFFFFVLSLFVLLWHINVLWWIVYAHHLYVSAHVNHSIASLNIRHAKYKRRAFVRHGICMEQIRMQFEFPYQQQQQQNRIVSAPRWGQVKKL